MRTMTPDSIPVFLPNAGIGLNRGVFSPQIRAIDVFYTTPVITGFHVIGDTSKCDSIYLEIQGNDENSPKVLGFFALKTALKCSPEVQIEEIMGLPNDMAPEKEVLGFHAEIAGPKCSDLFLEITGEDENAPKVLGFYASF